MQEIKAMQWKHTAQLLFNVLPELRKEAKLISHPDGDKVITGVEPEVSEPELGTKGKEKALNATPKALITQP